MCSRASARVRRASSARAVSFPSSWCAPRRSPPGGRHRENIVNAVRLQANSSKSESCNTTIKALIKVARGFRNLDNMMALVYLRCSDIVVPLRNRIQPSAEYRRVSLAMATARWRNKEERMQARTA